MTPSASVQTFNANSSLSLDELKVGFDLRAAAITDGTSPLDYPLKGSSLYNRELSLEERLSRGMKELEQYILKRKAELQTSPNDSIKLTAIKELTGMVRLYQRLQIFGTRQIIILDAIRDLRMNTDWKTKERACNTLQHTTDSDALSALCEVGIKHKSSAVRNSAASALVGTNDKPTLTWLYEVGLKDREWTTSLSSAKALVGTRYEPAIRALCDMVLGHPDPETRQLSAFALRGTKDLYAIRMLHQVGLKDDTWEVRKASACALTGTKDRHALRALCITGMKDTVDAVREASAEALKGTTDQETVEWIYNGLKDSDWHLRETAAWALEERKDLKVIEALCETVANDESNAVRFAAKSSLEKSLEKIEEPALRIKIKEALSKYDGDHL